MDRTELSERLMALPKEAAIRGILDTVLVVNPGEAYRAALSIAREAEQQKGQEALARSIQYGKAAAEDGPIDDVEAADAAYREYRRHAGRAEKLWHQLLDAYKL